MKFLKENKENIIVIKEEYQYHKRKKLKKILTISGCVCIVIGGVVINALVNAQAESKAKAEREEYLLKQSSYNQKTISEAEAFIDTLNTKLSTVDQYHSVLSGTVNLYNYVKYTEDVESLKLLGFDIEWKNEYVEIFGFADAFFEYGTTLKELKTEIVNDNEVNIYVKKAKFRKESAHRIAGTYTPDPQNPNNYSWSAKNKNYRELNKFFFSEKASNTISERAMIKWEDQFDKNIESGVAEIHSKDDTLKNLDKITKESILDLINTFNIANDVKINIIVE